MGSGQRQISPSAHAGQDEGPCGQDLCAMLAKGNESNTAVAKRNG